MSEHIEYPVAGELSNITVFKADGTVVNLGTPKTRKFERRLRRYVQSMEGTDNG